MTWLLPPLTYNTVGCWIPVASLPIYMCPTQWLTPISGILNISDNVLATRAQTLRGGPMPGPFVYAISAQFDRKYRYLSLAIVWPLWAPTLSAARFALRDDRLSLSAGNQCQEVWQKFCEDLPRCFLRNQRCLYWWLCTYSYFVGAAFDPDHKTCSLHNKRNIKNSIKPHWIS